MLKLPEELVTLLHERAICYISTVMPDGSPQVTLTWVDTDGEHVIINSVSTHVKVKNIRRDPRVAVAISSPEHPTRYFQVRGRVIQLTTEGAADHIEALSQKYNGAPYGWHSGRDQQRIILVIEPDHITSMGFGRRPPASPPQTI